jgi:sugar lactone lactonase YvrE
MSTRVLRTLLEGGDFFESPRFESGRWWVSDFYRHRVLAVDADGQQEVMMHVEGQPSGLGWLPDGSMLVVSMKDHRVLRQHPGGEISEHADLTDQCGGHLNDLVVDKDGRAYVGDFGFDLMAGGQPARTSLKRVDPDGTVTVVAEDLAFPNGMIVTPDGLTLYVGETAASRYTAFAIREDGGLGERRVLFQLDPEPPMGSFDEMIAGLGYAPDGCCLDADGHIWSADALGQRCLRISPNGEILDEVRPPDGLGVFACMLGGADGSTLLLCSAPDFGEHSRAGRRAAVLFTTEVDVPHAGRP